MGMKVDIDFTKSAQDNADSYYRLSKKLKKKIAGASIAISDLEAKRSTIESKPKPVKEVRKIEEKKWFEKFNWFMTSNNMLAIGGRSAVQNELVNSKYFENTDIFFHADIFGASVVILKDGLNAPREIKEEVAQFAGCFSKAWEGGMSSVNVYSVKREQVTKSKEKGSLGTGSFLIEGEREWFKGMGLELCAFKEIEGQKPTIVPVSTAMALGVKKFILLKPGKVKKSDAAKTLSRKLDYNDLDYIMQHLPAGSFSLKE
jgi:predicted ribosome quality control (RQC) complex YloA/Tae2 family protein